MITDRVALDAGAYARAQVIPAHASDGLYQPTPVESARLQEVEAHFLAGVASAEAAAVRSRRAALSAAASQRRARRSSSGV